MMELQGMYGNQALMVTSYPPRECGIATYAEDLAKAIMDLNGCIGIRICAIEKRGISRSYPREVMCLLDADEPNLYIHSAEMINQYEDIDLVLLQHEFGLFTGKYGDSLLAFLHTLRKPVVVTFHTVLPNPSDELRYTVRVISKAVSHIVVMTRDSGKILIQDYGISPRKIEFIPHGTHPVELRNQEELKAKYGLSGRQILSTFGFIGVNKNIETVLESLTRVVKKYPDVIYLIIGASHPDTPADQLSYRGFLEEKVEKLRLGKNVRFINRYVELTELLELLQMTDIYLLPSKDRNQAVSGTFAYALSCGCPIISTPIPHAREFLGEDKGILVDFQNPQGFANAILKLLGDDQLRLRMSENAFQGSKSTEWGNVAKGYVGLSSRTLKNSNIPARLPSISLAHLKRLTCGLGIIQFAEVTTPVLGSGHTVDDNARALIAMCYHYEWTGDLEDISLIGKYLKLILMCQHEDGQFINYVDVHGNVLPQNGCVNLEDSNGRAIWALGILIAVERDLPRDLIAGARDCIDRAVASISGFESPRAMAFCIKGLYFYHLSNDRPDVLLLVKKMANDLATKYLALKDSPWHWFENYLTYGNSVLPEALLYAYLADKPAGKLYRDIAVESFDFLLEHTIKDQMIRVVPNRGWMVKGEMSNEAGGEQPVDVSYTIEALYLFYRVFGNGHYSEKMEITFGWFFGNNILGEWMYDPMSGGCHDGLEKSNVNQNQGAESTVCYLMSRLTMEKFRTGNGHSTLQRNELIEEFEAIHE
jgi:glycosyltransferase involved in cell wall biosynthesis